MTTIDPGRTRQRTDRTTTDVVELAGIAGHDVPLERHVAEVPDQSHIRA